MKKFLPVLLLLLVFSTNVFAQSENAEVTEKAEPAENVEEEEDDAEEEFSLKDAMKQIKITKKEPSFSLEARPGENEIIFRYKNFSVDYNYIDSQRKLRYIKLNVNNELISMLGIGIDVNCGLTGITWKDADDNNLAVVPTVGIGAYATILPKLKIYTQFSGMPVGGFGRIYDAETGLRYSHRKYFTITAGYRHLSSKVHHHDSSISFQKTGPFIGIRTDF